MKKIILSIVTSNILLFGSTHSVGTDFDNAVVSEHTEESALSSLSTVNMILGFIHDCKADHFINKGAYKALLKSNENGGGASSGSGVSTTVEKLNPMTLIVTRDTNTTISTNPPMKIKFWLDDSDGPNNHPMRVIGYINVTHSVDSEYPVGQLRLDFKGYTLTPSGDTNTSNPIMKGVMTLDKARGTDSADGRADVKFYQQNSQDGGTTWGNTEILNMTYDVNVDTNGDGVVDSRDVQGSGVAYTRTENRSSREGAMASYEISFTNDHYKIQEVNATDTTNRNDPVTGNSITAYSLIGNAVCKSKTNFTKKVYKYGLFDSNGAKISINSGFPIKKGTGASAVHGYIGYWGLWSEANAIKAGDSVTRDDGYNGSYNVFQTKGKLIKHTKMTKQMQDLANSKLVINTWIGSDFSTVGNYIMHWDATNEKFIVDGKEICNENGCETNTSIGATIFSSPSVSTDLNISNWSKAWSESLHAEIPVKSGLSNSSEVAFYKQEVINPSTNMTLVNFGYEIINPDMNLSSTSNYVSESINADENSSVIGNVYTYDINNGVLLDHNRSDKPVIMPVDTNISVLDVNGSHSWWRWGASMGPLLPSDSSSVINHEYNQNNFWEVEQNEDVYYSWETGINSWNMVTGLKDGSGNVVSFDPPLEISYIHHTENDLNGDSTHDGEMFMLHYDGNNLGLPWTYNSETGWIPTINIKSGTLIGNSYQYTVKAIGIGDIPNVINGTCSGVINPSKDVNESFVPLENSFGNSALIDFNDSIIGSVVSTTPPSDVNVSVIKGRILR